MSSSELTHGRIGKPVLAEATSGRGFGGLGSARLAGVLYMAIIVLGIFAEVVVRSRLIDFDDASATAANILNSEHLFRAGFAADLVVFLCDVALAIVLYLLFRPVSRTLSMLAAVFRLTQTAIIGLNLLSMFVGLLILTRADYLDGFTTSQSQALALLFLDVHRYGYTLGLTFFGVSTVIVAYLVLRSGCIPRALGVLLALAGVGYIVDSAAFFLVPGYDGGASPVILAPALVGEVWFALWLLTKGKKLQALSERPTIEAA
jgi:hypothetical protein